MFVSLSDSVALNAASLAGVSLPDTEQVGGKSWSSTRRLSTKFTVKVYVAGLYLEQKSSDAKVIISPTRPSGSSCTSSRREQEPMADAFTDVQR